METTVKPVSMNGYGGSSITASGIGQKEIEKIINDGKEPLNMLFSNRLKTSRDKPKMKSYFGKLIQSNELSILFGTAGVGKSVLAFTIADCITKGNSILNQANGMPPTKLLYLDYELGYGAIQKRFGENYTPNENFLCPLIEDIYTYYENNTSWEVIKSLCKENNVKFLIIDNISAIALKSTQDQDFALSLMKNALDLKNELDMTVLILAHTTKRKENTPVNMYDLAGSAHLQNFADSIFTINNSNTAEGTKYIKQLKARNVELMENVLNVRITKDQFLTCEYLGETEEKEHFSEHTQKSQELKKQKYKSIARKYFETGMSYTDFIHSYVENELQSESNAKKVHGTLKELNLIVKINNKWVFNENEEEN